MDGNETTYCDYCGERFSDATKIGLHFRACPKHPMRDTECLLKAELEKNERLEVVIHGLRRMAESGCSMKDIIDGMRLVARRALLADDEVIETIGGTEVTLLRENATLRTRISLLELALDEIYCSVRRAKPAPECPTDCKAVLHDELYARNIELLHIAVRNHNAECDALEKVHRLEERNDDCNAELMRLRNIIAENNIKPGVTGQGVPPRPPPKKG